jgi:hypothetical protein
MTGDRDRQTDRAKPLARLGRSGDLVPMSLEPASNGRLLTTALGQAARHRFDQAIRATTYRTTRQPPGALLKSLVSRSELTRNGRGAAAERGSRRPGEGLVRQRSSPRNAWPGGARMNGEATLSGGLAGDRGVDGGRAAARRMMMHGVLRQCRDEERGVAGRGAVLAGGSCHLRVRRSARARGRSVTVACASRRLWPAG